LLIPTFLLLGSMATAYLSPTKLHVFAFAGYVFPILWLLNLILLIFFLFRRSFFLIIPLVAIVISFSHWNNVFQIKGKVISDKSDLERPISIMSFNTRMFDFYNHSNLPNTPDEIFKKILQQDVDIICFQEYFTSMRREEFTPTAITARFINYKHRHIEYFTTHKGNTGYGVAIFSKYPIIEGGVIRFENSKNLAIYADVNVNGKIVRLFNNHLESIGFKEHDFNLLDSLEFRLSDSQKQGLKNISRKLNRAFTQRSTQAESIARHINNSPYPVIVCGDFNDTPVSYVYRTMRANLKDAFRESGVGFGGTYNGRLPSFRIDYIFHSPQFDSYNFKVLPFPYSDHYPITTIIDLKQ
jgi:endonuclease/exonuclease/phosphatase family metal-dependent hydrolase